MPADSTDAPFEGTWSTPPATPRLRRPSFPEVALVTILLVAGALRFVGLNWDSQTHLHPDERFLTMVETGIRIPSSIGEYFDTDRSPLNPHNAGFSFFVYGTLPVFFVRFLAESLGMTGYDQIHVLGRAASAGFDLLSVFLVYLVGSRLYRRRVGLLAAAFAATSVLLIQHAHFFIVDPFANTFILGGIYFAVRALDESRTRDYVLFGLMLGMAAASKLNAAPLAGVIVLVSVIRLSRHYEDRAAAVRFELQGVLLAAVVSMITFRVFQPYAFAGASLLSLRLNPRWLANLAELANQLRGDVDFPPALQWVNRAPVLFSLSNLVRWGLGAPLGVLAWIGWGWALWQAGTGVWKRHLIPVIWTGGYFLWQSLTFTKAMRYQLPIYPTLALLAAWAAWEAWDWAHALSEERTRRIASSAVGAIGGGVVAATLIWAVAFTANYVRPVTRVAATRWIYSHIPGAANLVLDSPDGATLEPIPVDRTFILVPGDPYTATFRSGQEGELLGIQLEVRSALAGGQQPGLLYAQVLDGGESEVPLASTSSVWMPTESGSFLDVRFGEPTHVSPGELLRLRLDLEGAVALDLGEQLRIVFGQGENESTQDLSLPRTRVGVPASGPLRMPFTSHATGRVTHFLLPHLAAPDQTLLAVSLLDGSDPPILLATANTSKSDPGEARLELTLDHPVDIQVGKAYTLQIETRDGAWLSLRGSTIISESSWDDGLPLPMDGWDGYGGLYSGVTQELYWPDEQDDDSDGVSDKLERLVDSLDNGDYLVISSNRQYGTIPRVETRYPLTSQYYRALFDCQAPASVVACGARAQAGESVDQLGYALIAVFENDPQLGPIRIPDQAAEETFTVYDHPKVMVFQKAPGFSDAHVLQILGNVDVSRVVRTNPNGRSASTKTLLLPPDRLQADRAGGTWSELFNPGSLVNRSQVLAVVVWWVSIGILGLLAFPLTRAALPGLQEEAYPLARLVGILVVAWGSWMIGSANFPVSRSAILGVVFLLTAWSALLAWRDRQVLISYVKANRREIAWIEILALSFFLVDLFIRLGNPDLWHPSKGGEKPMDFSYLNAVIKSTTFPPFDPWFSGGYINYYYFGFVLVGIPIKLLGINPTVAYNLVIPTLFALLGLAGYAVGSGLVEHASSYIDFRRPSRRLAGTAAALALVVLGNLGTARMIYEGFKRLGAPAGGEPAGSIVGFLEATRGVGRFLTLQGGMPYALDSWYWDPSRAIPPATGEPGPITEFPFFTFLYADLHAHMINFPFTVLTLAWGLSWIIHANRGRPLWPPGLAACLFIGGLAFGVIRPTNTWDFPVYWLLGLLAVAGAAWVRHAGARRPFIFETVLASALLFGAALALFQPYTHWYAQGYNDVEFWEGSHTTFTAYLTVHGLFLFTIVSWMVMETVRWMAETPLSALAGLRARLGTILTGLILLVSMILVLTLVGYAIAPIVFLLLAWAMLLFFRPGMPVLKRAVLVMTAAALALTFMVEVIVLVGDIGRMNTVFKFYLQVWTLFGLSAAAAFAWVVAEVPFWSSRWRNAWVALAALAVFSAALYPLLATSAKIRDRMVSEAPHTLDGAAFMPYAVYYDQGSSFQMDEDYRAIRWMQDNVQGSPVIVEANLPPYRWGSRFTIFTGLPGVLGWDWHQRQQRLAAGDTPITRRAEEIADFYLTRSPQEALAFLHKYDVRYIIVGRLEAMYYATVMPCLPIDGGARVTCDMTGRPVGMRVPEMPAVTCEPLDPQNPDAGLVCPTHGLDKFAGMTDSGALARVYEDGQTAVYEVLK